MPAKSRFEASAALPLPPGDPFYSTLKEILSRNYPPLRLQRDSTLPIPEPLSFHDKHVSPNLLLKAVKIIPSLHRDLASLCDTSLSEFVKGGHKFDSSHYRPEGGIIDEDIHYATSVAESHILGIALDSIQLATKMFIHPRAQEWTKLFAFYSEDSRPRTEEPFLNEGRVFPAFKNLYSTNQIPKPMLDTLDAATIEKLNDFFELFRWLGFWSFYALTPPGIGILKRMAASSTFKWKGTNTTGFTARGIPPLPPPDSPRGMPFKGVIGSLKPRSSHPKGKSGGSRRTKEFVGIPGRKGKTKRNYRPVSEDYIQRAWTYAVMHDTTFLIFNCGSHERIGVRHRASQTLFLSDLIDTTATTPTCGQIHLGLHLAMLQDALARYEVKKTYIEDVARKRDSLHLDAHPPAPKRQKFKGDDPHEDGVEDENEVSFKLANDHETYEVSEAEKAFSQRNILLLRLDYRHFFSPSPSSFVRLGSSCVRGLFDKDFEPEIIKATARRYLTEHYATVTIGAPLNHGAVGVVHRGIIDVETTTGTLQHPCLVKMVYEKHQRDALIKEFGIYKHLARKNLFEGVLRVHGLFEDLETSAMAMIMDYGGRDLRYRALLEDKDFDESYIVMPDDALDIYTRALTQVHQAGVIHNDIRLENLVINDTNEVAIIDFDRAQFCREPDKFESEIADLNGVVLVDGDSESGTDSGQEYGSHSVASALADEEVG